MSRHERGNADSFIEGLCIYRGLVFVIFIISVVFFLLSAISYGVVEPGTETYVVVVLNMIGLGVFVVFTGTVLVLCRDKDYLR